MDVPLPLTRWSGKRLDGASGYQAILTCDIPQRRRGLSIHTGDTDPISGGKQLRTDRHLELRKKYGNFVSLKNRQNRR